MSNVSCGKSNIIGDAAATLLLLLLPSFLAREHRGHSLIIAAIFLDPQRIAVAVRLAAHPMRATGAKPATDPEPAQRG